MFETCDPRTPIQVLAEAVFSTLEKHLFDEMTARTDVASNFCITAAQLHKSITGVDYKSGPHVYKKKRKITDTVSSTSKIKKPAQGPSLATAEEMPQTQETSQEAEDDDPNTEPVPVEDTLSSSSDSLYNPL